MPYNAIKGILIEKLSF